MESFPLGSPQEYVDIENGAANSHRSNEDSLAGSDLEVQSSSSTTESLLPRSTRFGQIMMFHLIFLAVHVLLLLGCLFSFRDDWGRECDLAVKAWVVVCALRGALLRVVQLALLQQRLRELSDPRSLAGPWVMATRALQIFGLLWWGFGIKLLFYTPACPGGEESVARSVALVCFWILAAWYSGPLLLYGMFCLCLPCLVFVLVRVSTNRTQRQPTPASVLAALQIKKYRELIASLQQRYDIENALPEEISSRESSSLLPTISLENVLGGVSALLGGNGETGSGEEEVGVPSSEQRLNDRSINAESLRAPLGAPRISINKTCPICMIDLLDDDLVLVMPCDSRHFFHQACVKHWLQTSQACPICRANIVHLVESSRQPPDAHAEAGVSPRPGNEAQGMSAPAP